MSTGETEDLYLGPEVNTAAPSLHPTELGGFAAQDIVRLDLGLSQDNPLSDAAGGFGHNTETSLDKSQIEEAPSVVHDDSKENDSGEKQNVTEGLTLKNRLAKELGIDPETVHKAAVAYQDTYPEWFILHADRAGHVRPHYHPELANLLREDLAHRKSSPEGWMAVSVLARTLDFTSSTIQRVAEQCRDEHPEWFGTYKLPDGKLSVHYHPDLVSLVNSKLSGQDLAPKGWTTNSSLAKELSVDHDTVKKFAASFEETHSEWFKAYRDGSKKLSTHYHPDLAAHIRKEISSRQSAPEGWSTTHGLTTELKVGAERITRIANAHRDSHPEWFHTYSLSQRKYNVEHYHPELVNLVRDEIRKIEVANPEWRTKTELAVNLSVTTTTVAKVAESYREEHPEWFAERKNSTTGKGSGKVLEYYHPDLTAAIQQQLTEHSKAPESWRTASSMAAELGLDHRMVKRRAASFKESHPEWFATYKDAMGRPVEHLHSDLQAEIIPLLKSALSDRAGQKHLQSEQQDLQKSLTGLLTDIGSRESIQAQEFQTLVGLFGAERAVDILYQQHPEYKKLPVPYVKSVLADYLGGFLTVKGGFSLDGLEKGAPFLAHGVFKEGLTEIIKNDCLRLLNTLSKTNPEQVTIDSISEYINHIRQKTGGFTTADLEEVLDEVEAYYELLFENIHKPDRFVDGLEEGRFFPDINQRINVQEIAFKKKVLIGDDMGMGKSASAIMAKEIIGARQALVIVPSNVLSVWQNYLSDRVGDDGEQIGYFKPGQAPNVLVVDSPEAAQAANSEDYDYILISQERLNDGYVTALEGFDYDMLIVDEMHKLKNLTSGKRAENLVRLAEWIDGEDRYLALLSGTPVPNKIGDVAMTLKLLYPERFAHVDNKKLVSQILDGDMLDLRSLLVPRMQMKSLAESVDMPELEETVHSLELSDQEKEIYEVLIEEDELTATEKLTILRQFVMNPRLVDATPDIRGTKVHEVGEALRQTFSEKDKVVMFVNSYVEGVIRGDNTILEELNIPPDVDVYTIDGSVSKQRRLEIEQELRQPDRRILLLVSGQTADVGVDFSAAQEVFHYNEPWSLYEKGQQRSRVYRPGLKDKLTTRTFIAEGTIEQGIHTYIESKYQAIEKLLKGIPVSEIEKEMLRQAEKQADSDVEVNPDLAKYYFSSWDKMMKIYSHVKELGEEDFKKFLTQYDRDYADSYADLVGSRSYQANVARLSGSLISAMAREKGQQRNAVRILDLASGPEMLKRHMPEDTAEQVVSLDINKRHFSEPGKKAVGSFVSLPIADKSVDYVNLSLALHYTKFVPSKNNYERLKVLQEVNRVLVTGGRATISMIYSLSLDDTQAFQDAIGKLGLKVVQAYSGDASAGKNFQSQVITLEKVADCSRDTQKLAKSIGLKGLHAFKFKQTARSLRNSLKIIQAFSLGDRMLNVELNSDDRAVLAEEERVMNEMENLKQTYGSIEDIPKTDIYQHGLARVFNGKRYVLFKRLTTDKGAVAIH